MNWMAEDVLTRGAQPTAAGAGVKGASRRHLRGHIMRAFVRRPLVGDLLRAHHQRRRFTPDSGSYSNPPEIGPSIPALALALFIYCRGFMAIPWIKCSGPLKTVGLNGVDSTAAWSYHLLSAQQQCALMVQDSEWAMNVVFSI